MKEQADRDINSLVEPRERAHARLVHDSSCQVVGSLSFSLLLNLTPWFVPVPGQAAFVSQGYLFWGPIAALFIFLFVLVLFKVNIDPDFERLMAEYSTAEKELNT